MTHEARIGDNGVNGTQADSVDASPGRVTWEQQQGPGRNPDTARLRWTKEVNKLVMKCYIQSDPSKRGYRKRMLAIWAEIGVFETSEQRLADQARAIKVNGWLSEVEIEEIKSKILEERVEYQMTERAL